MRPRLALVFTIFTILGAVLSANADLTPLRLHELRDASPTNSSSSSTSTSSSTGGSSSTSTTATSSSSSTPTSSTQSTSISTSSSSFSPSSSFSSSSESSFSSFSSSSPSSTQASSSSQDTSPSSQPSSSSSQTSTSFFVSSDTRSSRVSSQTRTTFTSTAPNGSLFTVTAVVSSPSGGSDSSNISTGRHGFFANTGAVAGTFLVVGLIGTGVLICVLLSAWRRYRRHKRYQAYFDDEVKEFSQPRERGDTPDATLPDLTRDSTMGTPVSSSPIPNMIEQLHGNEATIPNASYGPSHYQAGPGEFNPYQSHNDAYAYSDEQPVYGQYPGGDQPGDMAYAYQPGTEYNGSAGQYEAAAGPSHAPQGAVASRVNSNH